MVRFPVDTPVLLFTALPVGNSLLAQELALVEDQVRIYDDWPGVIDIGLADMSTVGGMSEELPIEKTGEKDEELLLFQTASIL